MNIALRRTVTFEEYLAWGDSQSERVRSELINGQIVLMAPERVQHVETKFAVTVALTNAIMRAGLPCHALVDGIAIRIDDHTAYEPDALVYCGERLARDSLVAPNPMIVVEVLSPASAHSDTSAKLIGYFKVPSVMHYLIVDADRRSVTHYARGREAVVLTGGGLRLDPPGLVLEVSAFIAQ
jgi:Uma2 family endonuclease